MKNQTFGVEIELTGITRSQAADILADHFNTTKTHTGEGYDKYVVRDDEGRKWTIMSDGSIETERKDHGPTDYTYKVEFVTPICKWGDIETIQEIVRKMRKKGGLSNSSCGIHVHIGAEQHTAKTLRNLVNIMASKEDLIFKAVGVTEEREHWCKKADERIVQTINRNKPATMDAIKRIWYNGGDNSYSHYDSSRYHALNLHSLWQGKGIEFRCFNGTMHAGRVKTYIQLCLAINHQALTQNSASYKKTVTTNDKYTFRTWLLRLGMIGEEFETARKFLLENLSGDIAFRNGRPASMAA